ncbi:hypothetical protein ACLOJK_034206 [Asimina triloba]
MGRRRRDGDADDEMDWRRDGDDDDALLLPMLCVCCGMWRRRRDMPEKKSRWVGETTEPRRWEEQRQWEKQLK